MTEDRKGLGAVKVIEMYSAQTLVTQEMLTNEDGKRIKEKKIEEDANSLDQVIKKDENKRVDTIIEKLPPDRTVEKHCVLLYQSSTEKCITLNETSDQSAFPPETELAKGSPSTRNQDGRSTIGVLAEMDLDYLNISIPLCKLPFYHYRKYPEQLTEKITNKGDYLVFLNVNDHSKPTLYVRDEGNNINEIPIKSDSKGYFILHPEDAKEKFTTIGQLIHFYAAEKLDVKKLNNVPCYLRKPVLDPEYQAPLLVEKSSRMDTWAYFHPLNSPLKSVASALARNGDYILFGKEENPNHHRFVVKWEECLYILQFRPDTQGRWVLPRVEEDEPTETVETLDQLVKSCARAKAIIHGICFVKPIKTGRPAPIKIADVSSTAEVKKENGQLVHEEYAQTNMAPRPLYALPAYFGKLSIGEAVTNLKNSGEYLLYTDIKTKRLELAVCWITENETIIYSVHITKNKEGFFQIKPTDAGRKFGTVDELVTYYEASHQPIQFIDRGENLRSELHLLKPIHRHSLCDEQSLFEEDDDSCFLWCHERVGKKKAHMLLKNSGDYLFRLTKEGRLIVTVRWNDKCYDLKLKPFRRHRKEEYELPKYDQAEPTERATDIFDFVKSAATSQMQFNGMVLKNCVLTRRI